LVFRYYLKLYPFCELQAVIQGPFDNDNDQAPDPDPPKVAPMNLESDEDDSLEYAPAAINIQGLKQFATTKC
jgi:hypothetical protein